MYTANMVKQRSYWEWRYAVDILISCHSHLTTEQIFKTKFEQQIIWHFNTLVVSKCVIGVNWRLHKVPPMVCVPNILLWSILCKTVGLLSSTGESERTARGQFHSPTLRCFRGRLCEVAAGRGPLKQSRWPESNWTLPLRSVGVAPSLGRFWLVFTALKLRYVLRRHIILSDSDGNQGVLDCFTVYPGLGGSAK